MLTPDQLRERKKGIGGSDAAAICGLSKWKTPVDVYLDKTTEEIKEYSNHTLERGNILEPLLKELFNKQFNVNVQTLDTIWSKEHAFMFANLDGVLRDQEVLVDFKHYNRFKEKEWEEEWSDQIPEDYLLQMQHYLAVTKLKKALVIVQFAEESIFESLYKIIISEDGGIHKALEFVKSEWLPLKPLKIYEVYPHEKLINKIIKIEKEFWHENVLKRIPPTWTTRDDLAKLFPVAKEKSVIANQEEINMVTEREIKKKEIEILEKEIEKIGILLRGKMKDASFLKNPEGKNLVIWKNQRRKRLKQKELVADHPEIAKNYYVDEEFRVFRFVGD